MLPIYQRSYHHTFNMADINNKPKLQLRAGLSVNGDKTPSPATKLLISHGKPNFTIQRSPKIQNGNGSMNGNGNPLSPQIAPKNEFVVKSTTFNGVFKPSNMSVASKQSLQQNGSDDNEAAKVVLRRTKVVETPLKEGEDENVPEFIRRQRRIQERLANENLDFENRRSGYFTQVMISPSSPNRKSFVETMSSPAVVPGLEIPPPVQPEKIEESEEEKKHEESKEELLKEIAQEIVQETSNGHEEVLAEVVPAVQNGHDEEEEVNKAIEEVNKAVAGEDDDTKPEETQVEAPIQAVVTSALIEEEPKVEVEAPAVQAVVTSALMEEPQAEIEAPVHAVVTSALMEEPQAVEEAPVQAVVTSALMVEEAEKPQENGHVEAVVTSALITDEEPQQAESNGIETEAEPKTNGVVEEPQQNGLFNGQTNGHDEITISHTNALSSPSIPSPDPSGEKGVNYEPKTVVSFSRDMGEPNKYPDTVKVVKDGETPSAADDDLKELVKLKFEIKADDKDIEVTPVLKVE